MPGGIPVACVAIGKAGAKNAGFLAAQIIGVANPDIAKNVRDQREKSVREIADKDQALQQEIDRR